jgi:excisionase family DNA binding protein
MTHQKVPEAIASAVNALVQPYGLNSDALFKPQPEPRDAFAGKKYLSVKEAEEYSSVSRYTLHRAVKAGELAVCKLSCAKNGKILIAAEELDRWINSKQIKQEVM